MEVHEFDEVFKIMENSFPSDEYRTYDEQKNLLNKNNYKIYICRQNSDITAFVAVWEFHRFLFVEHFAVDSAFRGKGLGSQILCELSCLTKKQMCLEVEPPKDDLSTRRIAFYQRNGFFLNEFPYMQPSISKGKSPVKLKIMTFGSKASKLKFNDIKYTLYTKVYNILL